MAMRKRILAAVLSAILSAGAAAAPCAAYTAQISADGPDGGLAGGTVVETAELEIAESRNEGQETGEEAKNSEGTDKDKAGSDGNIAISGEAADILAGYGIDVSGFSLPADKVSKILNYLVRNVDEADIEKFNNNLELVEKVLSSNDFQGLFNYQEVRELFIEVMASAVDFAISDQALSEKILVTLGLDSAVASTLVDALVYSGLTGNEIRQLPADEKALYDLQQLTTVAIAVLRESREMIQGVEVLKK